MSSWLQKKCRACEGGVAPMAEPRILELLADIPGWHYRDGALERTFEFRNFDDTIAFVNAVAWIARRENHHPDVTFGYRRCTIRYRTHAVNGVTENDFICAAKIGTLLDG